MQRALCLLLVLLGGAATPAQPAQQGVAPAGAPDSAAARWRELQPRLQQHAQQRQARHQLQRQAQQPAYAGEDADAAVLGAAGRQLLAQAPPPPLYTCAAATARQRAIGSALMQLYAGLRGPAAPAQPWHQRDARDACLPVCDSLPAYCSWMGVTCCASISATAGADTSPACTRADEAANCPPGENGAVLQLDMTQFELKGTLSEAVMDVLLLLSRMGLSTLDLSSNDISGPIPASIGQLGRNLTAINFNFNRLTGTIPPQISKLGHLRHFYASFNGLEGTLDGRFCTRPKSSLEILVLRANRLHGSLNMQPCKQLLMLDVQDNRFSGSLPIGAANQRLISLRANNNLFRGSIHQDIWRLPVLATIDLTNNELSGTISPYCGSVNNLLNVLLGNNSLRGRVPGNATSNSQLISLELWDNPHLHGTFPDSRSMVGLRHLDIHNTSISGTIPLAWGHLPYLAYVDISHTRMSCCSNQTQADDPSFPKLPPFLTFTNQLSQFDLSRAAVKLGEVYEELLSQPSNVLCKGVGRRVMPERQWNTLHLPVTSDVLLHQRWNVGPVYTWFSNCTCTKFFDKQPERYRYAAVQAWCNATPYVPAGPCLEMSIFKCAPLQDRGLSPSARAALGTALAIIAVGLCLFAYLSLSRASKLRRFVQLTTWRMMGAPRHGRMSLVVTDIEGYSDIMKRCPEVMFKALIQHNTTIRAAKYANGGFVMEQEGDSFTLAFYAAFDAVVFCLQAQQALLELNWPLGLEQQEHDVVPHGSINSRKGGSKLQMRLSSLLTPGVRLKRGPSTFRSGMSMSNVVDGRLIGSAHLHLPSMRSHMPGDALFRGLRVRMGVVSGEVPSGTPIKNSALFQLAKVVGDFGNGGQVILDDATFEAVKEHLKVLGAVGPNGINHSKLYSGRSMFSWLWRLIGCADGPRVVAEEAVALDMGAFAQLHPGATEDELPYTTSRQLDVARPPSRKERAPRQGAAGSEPGSPARRDSSWWARACGSCTAGACGSRTCSVASDADMTELAGSGSPLTLSGRPLPPAAQQSRPYLGQQPAPGSSAFAGGHAQGGSATSSGHGIGGGGGSSGGGGGGGLAGQASDGAGSGAGLADGPLRRRSALLVAQQASFSAAAWTRRQLHDLRRSLGRSGSLQRMAMLRRDWESVRLYQVLPPALAARAHVWHNQLNVKEGWVCWDNLYFEAPGSTLAPLTGGNVDVLSSGGSCQVMAEHSLSAPTTPTARRTTGGGGGGAALLGGSDSGPEAGVAGADASSSTHAPASTVLSNTSLAPLQLLQPLPPVTMVFMAAEFPELLMRKRRPFAPKVQALLRRVVGDALRRTGGYLCRVQEGSLRFMLAFASPIAALEWCLLVQVSSMYLQWPQDSVLLYNSCRALTDPGGKLVFRGPRLKMGVCEGVPRSIIPDHEGRADYHGHEVNMAARFMDKGARGGQIACTLELAAKAMALWASGACSTGAGAPLLTCHGSIAEDASPLSPDADGGHGRSAGLPDAAPTPAAACDQLHGSGGGAAASNGGVQPLDLELQPVAGQDAPVVPGIASGGGGGGSSGGSQPPSPPKRGGSGRGRWWQRPVFSGPGSSSGGSNGGAQVPAASSSGGHGAGPLSTPFASLAARQRSSSASGSELPDAGAGAPGTAASAGSLGNSSSGALAARGSGGHAGSGMAASSSGRDLPFVSRLQLQSIESCEEPMSTPGSPTPSPTRASSSRGGGHTGTAAAAAGPPRGQCSASGTTSPPAQPQQQQAYARPPLLPPLRLSHLRVSAGNSSAHHLGHAAGGPQPSGAVAVAASPFVLRDVSRAPVKVELHRLGVFAFKGGAHRQEMVQLVASHLLGRLAFIEASGPVAASRKGQLLEHQEGRIGEPVEVLLPTLAQEYLARLPDRLTGLTCLPHSQSMALPRHADPWAPGQSLLHAQPQPAQQSQLLLRNYSRSVTLPARSSAPWSPPAPERQLQLLQQHQQPRLPHPHISWGSGIVAGPPGGAPNRRSSNPGPSSGGGGDVAALRIFSDGGVGGSGAAAAGHAPAAAASGLQGRRPASAEPALSTLPAAQASTKAAAPGSEPAEGASSSEHGGSGAGSSGAAGSTARAACGAARRSSSSSQGGGPEPASPDGSHGGVPRHDSCGSVAEAEDEEGGLDSVALNGGPPCGMRSKSEPGTAAAAAAAVAAVIRRGQSLGRS